VDRATGDLFVGDAGSGYVDVYGSSGEFETRFGGGLLDVAGLAVDEVNGDVYVADAFREAVVVFVPDGMGGFRLGGTWSGARVPGREFGEVAGVAVDNSHGMGAGDVYVVEARSASAPGGAVDVFRPAANPGEEGELLRRLTGGKLRGPNGVAVSSGTGRVLVADSAGGSVLAFGADGSFEERLSGKGSPYGSFAGKSEELGNVAGVTVDEASGEIYVAEAERHVVSEYSSTGVWEGWITTAGEGALGEPSGVALTSPGDVYVADAGVAVVDRFGPDVVVAAVQTGKVAKGLLTRTSAVLSGSINGEGKAAEYGFQYGPTPALGSQTPNHGSGSGEASVSTEVTGLRAGTVYYYRIVGEDEDGTNVGLMHSFQTPPAVEELETGPVNEPGTDGTTLTGKFNPDGVDAHYFFQWGPTSAYGNASPAPPGIDAGSGTSAVQAQTTLSGLSSNMVYHYRLVAENSFGTTYGADQTFTTSGPPRIDYEPATGLTQAQATIHAQIDADQLATTYRFQYGETISYGAEQPVGGEAIGSGSTPVARSVPLTSLSAGTTYHYRVVAENEAGVTDGPDQTLTTVPSAPVHATYATATTATEAMLHAQIDPLGNDTRYYFEYGTQDCQQNPNACTNVPTPPGEDIGSGSEDVAREVKLTGLQSATTYYYRVIATNVLGVTEGVERTFTTQPQTPVSLALADNRAWEMITPPDKGGAPVEALTREGGIILASSDGDKLAYVTNGALGEGRATEGNRSPEMQQILATRGESSWRSEDIATPSVNAKGVTAGHAPEYQFFTADLGNALVEPPAPGAEPPLAEGAEQSSIYLRDNATESYLPLVSEADTAPGTQANDKIHFLNATPDLKHVLFRSEVALIGPGSSPGLYEWSAGHLAFVSVFPNGKAAASAELGVFDSIVAGTLSEDGSRVVWTNPEDFNTRGGHLYLRDTVRGETIKLDAARGVAEPEKGSAVFQAASADDSRIFFTDKQRLTSDSTAEPSQEEPDLYECEIAETAGKLGCSLKDLTVDHNAGEHANVQGLLFGAGGDGTSVYLVAQGILADNRSGNGEHATAGSDNLYALSDGDEGWSTTFIATLSSEDGPEWEGNQNSNSAYLTARVSPSGRYLAFMSAAPITGYDNVDASPAANGARDEEVFLYDAVGQTLRCVSCNPSGARPVGVLDTENSGEGLGLFVDRRLVWGREGHERWIAGNIPGWTAESLTSALYQSRYLSDQGRLYFNSPDSLVPAAVDQKENVYEYEPNGVGSCQSSSGGCVSLLSDGSSEHESAFLEATPDGSNVFFLTESRLLPQDTDTAFDIYDARECTQTSPCLTPPVPAPAPCAETATCRPAQPAQPVPTAVGTAVFSGPGNPTPAVAPLAAKRAVEAKKTTKPLTRAQKLTHALESCRQHHRRAPGKRKVCERQAHQRYRKTHRSAKQAAAGIHPARAKGAGR
jgi:phosphodiesterase/alkaline phosphatase D-like protein